MARRRKRRPLNLPPILAILLIANVGAGVAYSRLTSVVKVRVVGAAEADRERIEGILGDLKDKPALSINPRAVETRLSERSAVAKAEMTRNVFGRAVVTVEYRRAVAKIVGRPGVGMSRDGVVFQTIEPLGDLPSVVLPEEANRPVLALTGTWRSGEVGALAAETQDIAEGEEKTFIPDANGGLCLNIGSKFAVQLGLPTRLDEKIEYLRRKLEEDPGLLASSKTLILVSLDRPTYAQGVANKQR